MNLNPLEQHIFAYFLLNGADDVSFAGRFFPRSDFVASLADKMQIALRKFGRPVAGATKPVADAFVEDLIAQEAMSTQTNKFGGTMHQFQNEKYREIVAALKASDPIVAKAEGNPDFWEQAFAGLVA